MTPALECRALRLSYGATDVLHGIDLAVAAGESVALLGPSGSGKTSLLYAVAGFLAPAAGEIALNGRVVSTPRTQEPPERRGVAMVFQHYALWPHMSALDTVAYPLRRAGRPRSEAPRRAQELLELMGVGALAERRPTELSGGEQQRVGLARAMARTPALFLFDEPSAHLDTPLRVVLQEELAQRRAATGAAALTATHDVAEALGGADRVALLRGGRIVQVGTPREVYEEPVDEWAARLTGPASVLDGGLLVRSDWVALGGDRDATVLQAWFRGSYTDYRLATQLGELIVREIGSPRAAAGDRVRWTLHRSWALPPS